MLRQTSLSKLSAVCAGACLLGLALLVGCDRLGLGRSQEISAEKTPAPMPPPVKTEVKDMQPALPPPTVSLPPGETTQTTKTAAKSPSPASSGIGASAVAAGPNLDTEPPARPPFDAGAEPEPPLAADELDKPMEPPPEAKGLLRMPDPEEKGALQDLWVDKEKKQIVLAGRICKRTGEMELFACFRRTKEHESIVSVRARGVAIHATLMALGIKPGRAVQFFPEFRAPEGPEIEVLVAWTDDKGKRQATLAQEWLHDRQPRPTMTQPFIFGGSGFWKDPDGEMHYMAEDGDFICVSNFASAMLDLPISSSSANANLMFDAYTERIPPAGTPVALILQQRLP